MVDVFEEVEEELRSARYQSFAKKAWPYALALAVAALVVTLGVWGWREYQNRQSAQASQSYQQGFDALQMNDLAGAETRFAAVAKSGPPAYRALAMMQQAGLRTRANKTAEAVALLDEAAKIAPTPLIGDAARLKAVYLLLDTAPLADIEARLKPIAETGHPFVFLAREALAMKQLAAGRTAEARTAFSALSITPNAGEGLQARARVAMALIDSGQAAKVSEVARAAAALPPGSVPPLGPPPGLPGQPPAQTPAPTTAPAGAAQ